MRKYVLPSILIALMATGAIALYAEESEASGAFSDTTVTIESGKDVEKDDTATVEAKEDESKDEEKASEDESTEGFPVEGTVQGDCLRIREWPWGPTMGQYNTGDKVTVLAKSGEFYKVEINGMTGYMHVNYISIPGAEASRVAPYYPADTATGGYLPKDEGVAQSKNGTSSGPSGAANVSYMGSSSDTGDLANYKGGKLPPAEFIKLFGPVARESMKNTGVPASVTLAQAILETGWGGSSIGDAKNLFGIKGTGPAGTTVVNTQECYDGSTYVTIKDGFRKYHSWQESIDDHAKLLQNSRYAPALNAYKQNHNADQYAEGIHKAGYATSPVYANSLKSLMKQYNLYEWDI